MAELTDRSKHINLVASISPDALVRISEGRKLLKNGGPHEVFNRIAPLVEALDEGLAVIEAGTKVNLNRMQIIGCVVALLEDALWNDEQ